MKKSSGLIAIAALAAAACVGPALAQEGGPIDPGVYNDVNVHWMSPFNSPTINTDTVNLDALDGVLGNYDAADLLEVRQRCSVVVTSDRDPPYAESAVTFCEAVFAWVAANRPDAPDTDAELAEMGG